MVSLVVYKYASYMYNLNTHIKKYYLLYIDMYTTHKSTHTASPSRAVAKLKLKNIKFMCEESTTGVRAQPPISCGLVFLLYMCAPVNCKMKKKKNVSLFFFFAAHFWLFFFFSLAPQVYMLVYMRALCLLYAYMMRWNVCVRARGWTHPIQEIQTFGSLIAL